MRFAIDIRYDSTPIAGTSVDTQEGETPDAVARRVVEYYARDAQRRQVTVIDPASLIYEVRGFVRAAAESGESARKVICFIDGAPHVSETRFQNVTRISARGPRAKTVPADNVTVVLVALSDEEIARKHETLRELLG